MNSTSIERRTAPSLLGPRQAPPASSPRGTASLTGLMHEGFYLLFMLRNGSAPPAAHVFMNTIRQYLDEFGRMAQKVHVEEADITAAKYAFCAALDEILLASPFALSKEWERRPLQLEVFGDQLAGEHFFDRLEQLRAHGARRLQALQVFHMCLLLGFQGKYAIGGAEKLGYLSARLGDDIAHIKGKSAGFAPRAARPDQIVNRQRSEVPLWVLSTLFALTAAGAWLGLKTSLTNSTMAGLAPYADLVKLAPRPAYLSITLP